MYIMDHNSYSEITPEIFRLANLIKLAMVSKAPSTDLPKIITSAMKKPLIYCSLISFRMKRNWKRSNHFWPVTVPFLPVLYAISL